MSYAVINIGHNPRKLIEETTYSYTEGGAPVNVTEYVDPPGLAGYRKCVHVPEKGVKIFSVKNKQEQTYGFESNKYSEATVYLWREDKRYEKPLLVQLGNSYFRSDDGQSWTRISLSPSEMVKILDSENCKRNGTHKIDLSKGHTFNRKDAPKSYKCSSCKEEEITITSEKCDGVIYSYHDTSKGLVSKVEDNGVDQNGIFVPLGTSRVYLFYARNRGNKCVLINMTKPKNLWYRRKSKRGSTWVQVEKGNEPIAYFDSFAILSIIQGSSTTPQTASTSYSRITTTMASLVATMVVGFFAWEGLMMVKNPDKSLILEVKNKFIKPE
ncbi:hypothetical protein BEWA_035580 [Theileria equi strain WA]|uniref:Uncharacterized protein n=1 Tax=Theileria equi strain WA TaxID=1537102 RepID=L1LDJ6_THEEQ|nr:hypothetical protein BEWA_035580 [Theileria equi strain WA]EKX73522.1 hypothetical protein BEWA_035580 [Theileria equi strain WA]|eukprot:XP_004832974.1 hypothetical protein BEWA_035580 [Theileria equi strain WA]